MSTLMKGLNRARENALVRRTLLLLLVVLLLLSGEAQAGFFFTEYTSFEVCTRAVVITAEQLKEGTESSELHYSRVRPGGDSASERLFRRLGMGGAIFSIPIMNAVELSNDTPVRFTGTVYKYRPGLLNRWLGGSREAIYYEVELLGEKALLHAGSFRVPPLPICEEAIQE